MAHEDAISHDAASLSTDGITRELSGSKAYAKQTAKHALVHSLNRPLFHIDLTSALQSAVANVERRGEVDVKPVGTEAI